MTMLKTQSKHCTVPRKKKTTGAFSGTRVMAVWVSCLQLSTLPFTCVFTFAFLLHSSQLLPIVQLTLAFDITILLHSSKLHPIVQFTFASTFTILLHLSFLRPIVHFTAEITAAG